MFVRWPETSSSRLYYVKLKIKTRSHRSQDKVIVSSYTEPDWFTCTGPCKVNKLTQELIQSDSHQFLKMLNIKVNDRHIQLYSHKKKKKKKKKKKLASRVGSLHPKRRQLCYPNLVEYIFNWHNCYNKTYLWVKHYRTFYKWGTIKVMPWNGQ